MESHHNMKNLKYDIPIERYFKNKVNADATSNENLFDEASNYEGGVDEFAETLPTEIIDIDKIVPTQEGLHLSKLNYIQGEITVLPILQKHDNGWYYVEDGHHRIVKMIMENKPIKVKVYSKINNGSNPDIIFASGGSLNKKWGSVGNMTKSEAKNFYESKEGKELDKQTYNKWKSLVNMSKSELENFYNSQEGKDAGLSPSEAKEKGIDSGRESARWIMKMKDIPYSEWTPNMWKWAKKQISFISRMSGNKGGLYDDKGNKTRKHTSLLIWGHNPEKNKYNDGGQFGGGKFDLGENHKPFIKVPKGGSSCANCEYLSEDKKNCVNKNFIEWYGKSELPEPIDEFCSDWYEPNKEYLSKGGELRFYSDCVGYPVLSDLEAIVDNEKEIKYNTFVANVNKEDRLAIERRLKYSDDFPITKDWHVKFFKSKDEDGNTVYFIRHSAIEYVFSKKGSGMDCEIDDFKHGGTLYNGIRVPETVNPRMVISAFANPIDDSKVEEYTNTMKEMMLSHDFPPITGFPTLIDENDIGDYFLSGEEITDEHVGKKAWKVWDGHHRTIAAINANLPYIQVELEKAAVTDMDEFLNNGGQILPMLIKYARIKPLREGGEERVVRVTPDAVGDYVAGYVVYYPAKSNNKVAYFTKPDFKILLDEGSYKLFTTLDEAEKSSFSKQSDAAIEDTLKLRQRMRSLLNLLKYKKVSGDENKTQEDLFIERVISLIYEGKDFKSKSDIERIAEKEFDFEDKRKVRELTEYAILFVGREIAKNYGNDIELAYNKMVSLYGNQPYSTHRTGTSVNLGQFSTPAPMAYLMGLYVGINESSDKVYFEPTAGNGMLTVAGQPQDFVVNELDMHRYNNLLKEPYKLILNQDANKKFHFDYKFDGLLANPPFSTTKSDVVVGGFHINGLEQQIIVHSLTYLKNEAKIAFIIGGHTEFDEAGRIKSKKDRAFLSYLFKHYYMDDVINISGSLYGRQGTTYPIRIILIAAKKSVAEGYYPLENKNIGKFESFSTKVIETFDELFKRTEKYIKKS